VPFINFDNIFSSLVIFYELTEMDGWTDVMFLITDVVGPDQVMIRENSP